MPDRKRKLNSDTGTDVGATLNHNDANETSSDTDETNIPILHEPSIDITVEYLKYLQEKGYRRFYQAVRYRGLFGKYDDANCNSLCTICKCGLVCSYEKKGDDIPVVTTYVDGTISIRTCPVVVYVVCIGSCKKYYQARDTIPMNVIRKEIDFMLYSDDSRWIRNQQFVESPFK